MKRSVLLLYRTLVLQNCHKNVPAHIQNQLRHPDNNNEEKKNLIMPFKIELKSGQEEYAAVVLKLYFSLPLELTG